MDGTKYLGVGARASAPAKVILFGEHSVVYGAPAIAAAIDRRTTVEITTLPEEIISLDFSAIGPVVTFPVSELEEEDKEGVNKAYRCARLVTRRFAHLFQRIEGIRVSARTDIAVGAGLGSSASFSIALCSAFVVFNKLILHSALADLKEEKMTEVLDLTRQCERIFHGNPSGLDESVVSAGGILFYTKSDGGRLIAEDLPVKIVVVDSEVSRDTGDVVRRTKELRDRFPTIIDLTFKAMRKVAEEAAEEIERHRSARRLIELARINHGLLTTLGVSHPTLERMKIAVADLDVGFKLTGAGCGGNAIILVPNYVEVQDVLDRLKDAGFEKAIAVKAGGTGIVAEVIEA